jgi:dipeptidyl-peptidase-3
MGNYNNFGDDKFIPEIDRKEFKNILEKYTDKSLIYNLDEMIEKNYSNPGTKFGYPPNYVSGYYSPNITEEEIKTIQEFMDQNNWSSYNTRIFKKNNEYVIKIASHNLSPIIENKK